jgi:hypothetical protein
MSRSRETWRLFSYGRIGGNPKCSQRGCAIRSGLHWLKAGRLLGGSEAGQDHIRLKPGLQPTSTNLSPTSEPSGEVYCRATAALTLAL